MSDTDSFIDEVTEEVRRDRLFGLMRRYGWIAILAVLVLVGGAAFNEWRKAQATARAETLGNALIAALDGSGETGARVAALGDIAAEGEAQALVDLLTAAAQGEAGERAAAAEKLRALAAQPGLRPIYRDLALLKAEMVSAQDTPPADRITALSALIAPGAPYRLLAEEQIAMAEIEAGSKDAALDRLTRIIQDASASEGLRRRGGQLIVALGGDVPGQ